MISHGRPYDCDAPGHDDSAPVTRCGQVSKGVSRQCNYRNEKHQWGPRRKPRVPADAPGAAWVQGKPLRRMPLEAPVAHRHLDPFRISGTVGNGERGNLQTGHQIRGDDDIDSIHGGPPNRFPRQVERPLSPRPVLIVSPQGRSGRSTAGNTSGRGCRHRCGFPGESVGVVESPGIAGDREPVRSGAVGSNAAGSGSGMPYRTGHRSTGYARPRRRAGQRGRKRVDRRVHRACGAGLRSSAGRAVHRLAVSRRAAGAAGRGGHRRRGPAAGRGSGRTSGCRRAVDPTLRHVRRRLHRG